MDVVNHGMKGRAPALFELAIEIEDQLSDLGTALANIQETIAKLMDFTTRKPPRGRLKSHVALRTFAGIDPRLG
jgi:hypothetical protein